MGTTQERSSMQGLKKPVFVLYVATDNGYELVGVVKNNNLFKTDRIVVKGVCIGEQTPILLSICSCEKLPSGKYAIGLPEKLMEGEEVELNVYLGQIASSLHVAIIKEPGIFVVGEEEVNAIYFSVERGVIDWPQICELRKKTAAYELPLSFYDVSSMELVVTIENMFDWENYMKLRLNMGVVS